MEGIWFEFTVIVLLILGNGFFAGAELALISVRRGRMAQLAAAGDKRARMVEQLHSDPHRFLATVQIGVTVVGTMASAVGGATAAEVLKPILQQAPLEVVRNAAQPIALFLVVGLIAGALNFLGVSAVAVQISWILFVIGMVLVAVHLFSNHPTTRVT